MALRITNGRLVGTAIFAIIGLVIMLGKPFGGLSAAGQNVLGLVTIALGLWIFRPANLPYAAGGMLLIGGGLAFGLPYNVVGAGFASSAFWVLLPALYFGYALQKTGLGKRIAFLVLKLFRPSYLTLVISWFIIGVVLSMLTPSITVRVAVVAPIALSVIEACGLPERSRGAALVTLVAWAMAVLPGTGWLTGSLYGPIFTSLYPAEIKALGTWDAWFQIMALPWLLVTVVFVVLLYFALRPGETLSIARSSFVEQYVALGRISRDETATLVILALAFVLFATERIHHIPTAVSALAAFFLLIACRIINVAEISSGVSWDVLLFIGVAVGLPAIFTNAQVSKWLVQLLGPTLLPIAAKPLLFLLVLVGILWVIRFVDVPWGLTTAAVVVPLLVPLYKEYGIHPVVATMVFTVASNCFFLGYQQPFVIMGEALTRGKGWAPYHVSVAGLCFAIAAVASILISAGYWKMIGVIP